MCIFISGICDHCRHHMELPRSETRRLKVDHLRAYKWYHTNRQVSGGMAMASHDHSEVWSDVG
jgi:hypothetical protein